mgnify:CR=1 FL=1|jgi:mRNA interferase YafQ
MREILVTSRFKKDLKKAKKRRKDLSKLEAVLDKLVASEALDARNKPHRLSGNWNPCWECHIEPNWLLIWDEDETTVTLIRTGTHSDLFD